MKKGMILASALLLLASCGKEATQKAGEKLTAAQEAYARGDYNEAKMQLDSIKLLYPKEFDVRRAGNQLMLQVELKEQEKSLVYLDSMKQVKEEEIAAVVGNYTLEKDAAYQQEGNYFWPTQTVEKNLHRSFLRFQVNEQGQLLMTSIYCGKRNIHHLAVRVTAPDGTFAQTPSSKDSYETSDLGEKIEKADYAVGADGNVMGFLYLNLDKRIKVDYLGEGKYSFVLPAADKLALERIYELSQLLAGREQIKKETDEAKLKAGFVKRKAKETRK
ncbi:MAG: hypothetical protein RR365_11345 [Bacteroides sp.]